MRTASTAAEPGSLAAYGFLGMPLAMAALPVYVQAPNYYSASLGLPLALTGAVLFLARLCDTVQDPWIGLWLERLARAGRLAPALQLAGVILALAFAGIWLPPVSGGWLGAWLAAMLVLAYSAHSVLQIAHLSWGARLGTAVVLGRGAAWREGMGLAGVVLASTLGIWLVQQYRSAWALPSYALLFAVLLGLGVMLLRAAPPWHGMQEASHQGWRRAWRTPPFRQLLLPYFLNALSVAIPATLVLFFIEDRLQAAPWAAAFLALYFVAAAASLPWWTRRAARLGRMRCWRAGMVLALLGFAATPWLAPQQAWVFGVACLVTGWALGADLVLPPLLLAERMPAQAQPSAYYGLSSMLGKLALASGALALPLLAQLGYQPGQAGSSTFWLALLYAGLPAACKLLALITLDRAARR